MKVSVFVWGVQKDPESRRFGQTDFGRQWKLELRGYEVPPAIGDTIDMAGTPVVVERRHWVSATEVRWLCKEDTAMWAYSYFQE